MNLFSIRKLGITCLLLLRLTPANAIGCFGGLFSKRNKVGPETKNQEEAQFPLKRTKTRNGLNDSSQKPSKQNDTTANPQTNNTGNQKQEEKEWRERILKDAELSDEFSKKISKEIKGIQQLGFS